MSVVFRKARNKWQVSATVNGKRIRLLCDTKKQAQEIDSDLKLKRLGFNGMSRSYTLSQAFASYLATESIQKTDASYKADKRLFEIAQAALPSGSVTNLTIEHLQLFQIHCSKQLQWSDTTVANRMKVLKAVFKKALVAGHIPKNPAEHWKVPPGEGVRRRAMTGPEFEKLIQVEMPPWLRGVLAFIRLTGARGASVAALTWGEVDFTSERLLLRSRKGALKKNRTIVFPIYDELFQLLARRRNESPLSRATDPVFFGENGKPLTAQQISMAAHRAIKRAGLEGVVLYSLRHSIATDLIERGVSTESAAKLMGHSSVNQLKTYTGGVSLESLRDSMRLIRSATVSEVLSPEGTVSTNVIPLHPTKTAK